MGAVELSILTPIPEGYILDPNAENPIVSGDGSNPLSCDFSRSRTVNLTYTLTSAAESQATSYHEHTVTIPRANQACLETGATVFIKTEGLSDTGTMTLASLDAEKKDEEGTAVSYGEDDIA